MRYLRFSRRAAIIAVLLVVVTGGVSVVAASADTLPSLTPNDEFYPGINQTSAEYISLPMGWPMSEGSPNIRIGIVDSGVNPDPDMPNLQPGFCVMASGCASPTDTADPNGHGTDMASIAGAAINNGIGIAGVGGGCSLVPIRVAGADDRHTGADLAAGIAKSSADGDQVINVSRNTDMGSNPDPNMDATIQNAYNNGSSVVIAAGNDASNNPSANVLASDNSEAIRVANVDPNTGMLMADSNYGPWVDIAAPGSFTGLGPAPAEHGTSTSAAVVSGVICQMLKCNPSLSPLQVKTILLATATPDPKLDIHYVNGVAQGGVVNDPAALLAAGCQSSTPPPSGGGGGSPPPTPAPPVATPPTPVTPAPTPATPTTSVTPVLVWVAVSHKGLGHVVPSPHQGKGLLPGSKVTLKAVPDKGWRFRSWGGACSGTTQATCKLVLLHRKTAVAVFVKARKSK